MKLTHLSVAIAILSMHPTGMAQQPHPQPSAHDKAAASKQAKTEAVAQVEVKGKNADYDPRRDDTATKTVINNDEIIKYGDTNVFDILKRAPGVTVIGNSISMRGLGNGYTQVMVNGERPPPGFSMDALTPEQIEKIEVIRAATAEHSMQAITGSINIVLKKVVAKPQRDLRLNASRSGERRELMALGTLAERSGALSYYLNGMLSQSVDTNARLLTDDLTSADGRLLQSRDRASTQRNRNTMAGFNPRLSWKLADGDQLNLGGFMQLQRFVFDNHTDATRSDGAFPLPDYTDRHSANTGHGGFAGVDLNWIGKIAGGKLDTMFSISRGDVRSATKSDASTADDATVLQRDNRSRTVNHNLRTSGKYTRSMWTGHALATGWEAASNRYADEAVRLEGLAGTAPVRTDETFSPLVTRFATYAQDEWNITKQWSMYLGARWETIRTESEGTGLDTTHSRSNVLSPVAQTLYKFADKSGRQLRMALTRTYKAPSVGQLSARRYRSDLNTRFAPDSSGNPTLRPELATGVDVTYEHFWAPGALFSAGASARHITDCMRTRLVQDANGYWLHQPLNDGSAHVYTMDIELKFPLKTVWPSAPGIDLRSSLNRNWSKVASVPGPDNRLDQQVPLVLVMGTDYKRDNISAGASFAFRAGGPVRISDEQRGVLQPKRELEAYVLYKIRTGLQLRTAISNALGQDQLGYSRYDDANGYSQSWSRMPLTPRLSVNLEMKF